MADTVKVNDQMFGVVHKGSGHLANSTAPDVCKTPSPGGPVPVPYPVIVSQSSDLANGTTTVKCDGEMVGIKGCEYSMCTGDEPGTAGGVVSSTFKKEAKFILFSFDVKMDGKNVCRFGDKMTMNHQNTVCMAGTVPTVVQVRDAKAVMQEMVDECELKTPLTKKKKKKSCTQLGREKHQCVDDKIADHQKKNPPNGDPAIEGEKGYKAPKLGPGNTMPAKIPPTPAGMPSRKSLIEAAIDKAVKAKTSVKTAIGRAIGGKVFPDAAILGKDGAKKFVDFKFPCPPGHPGKKKGEKRTMTEMSDKQQAQYDTLGKGTGATNWKTLVMRPTVFR